MKKKNSVSKIIIAVICTAVIVGVALLGIEFASELSDSKTTVEVSVEQMQEVIDRDFATLPAAIAYGTKEIYANIDLTVKSIEYGIEKDVILTCTYSTLDVAGVLTAEKLNSVLSEVYEFYIKNNQVNAMKIQVEFEEKIIDIIKTAKKRRARRHSAIFDNSIYPLCNQRIAPQKNQFE